MLSKSITIFEGVDGAGKTTAAKRYAKATGAKYIAFKEYPHMGPGYNRMYLEAMLPALMGWEGIVFDRSWLSEWPYADVYRNGQRRLTLHAQRVLERVALRCQTCVVLCNPGLEAIEESYRQRQQDEMLKNMDQVRQVYNTYLYPHTALPTIGYDYTLYPQEEGDIHLLSGIMKSRTQPIEHYIPVVGTQRAVLIVAGKYHHPVAECNLHTPIPFTDFNEAGRLSRLTSLLEEIHVREYKIMWVDTSWEHSHELLGEYPNSYVLALDEDATKLALQTRPREKVADLYNVFSRTEYNNAQHLLRRVSSTSFGDLYGK